MISQSFIDRGLFIVRIVCDRCDGECKVEHPLIEAYRKSQFNSWYDFFKASGMETQYLPTREEIDCPQCSGLGYEERELSIAHVVDHCSIPEDYLKGIIRMVIREAQVEKTILDSVFGPNSDDLTNRIKEIVADFLEPDELEQTIRQVIRKVQQEEQDRKDLAEFMEPDDYLDDTLPKKVFGPEGMRDLADFLDPEE